ncbi:MAG: ABC transporter permease [Bacteroidota bacterium]
MKQRLQSISGITYVCVVYYVLAALVTPGFFSINNTWNLLYNFFPLLILAGGQTYVMLTAGIDLSITSIIAVCSVVGGFVMSADTTPFASEGSMIFFGIIAMLLTGVAIGLFNGLSVASFQMPAFMVTLTTMMIFSGFAVWLTQSQNIYNLPEAFVDFPYRSVLGLPTPVLIGIVLVLLGYLLLRRTIWGEWIYAVGANRAAATVSGVNVGKTLLLVYAMSGLSGGIAAIFYTARLETGSPVMGQNILLDVIGAVVIGGTSLFGGRGKISWTITGALFMTILDNSLNLLGLSFFLIMIIKGIIILGTAVFNRLQERRWTSA